MSWRRGIAAGARAILPVAAGLLVACSAPARDVPPDVVAQFHDDARWVYGILTPLCPSTTQPALLSRYMPARNRMRALEIRAAGMPFGSILAGIRVNQARMREVADCDRPDGPGTAAEVDSQIRRLGPLVTRMEQVVSRYPAEGS